MKRKSGFTLIELLAVVAILLLLLSLLVPALSSVRERGNRTVCLSNQRQIFAALFNYAGDNNGHMPGGNATVAPGYGIDSTYAVAANLPMGTALLIGGLKTNSVGYLNREDNAGKLFYCPTWTHPFFQYNKKTITGLGEYGGWSSPGTPLPARHVGISYHYRSTFTNGSSSTGWSPPTTRQDRPGRTAIMSDHWYLWLLDNVWYGQYAHREGYNAIYLDGHVSWKPDPDLVMFYSPVANGGPAGWNAQERRWQSFFDK